MQILKPSTWLRFRAITERADNRQTQRRLENDSHIEHRRKSTQDPVHVVVFGNRGSRKSTLTKQVRIISLVGFTSGERYQAREAICKDFLHAFKEALDIMRINRVGFKSERAKANITTKVGEIQSFVDDIVKLQYPDAVQLIKQANALSTSQGIQSRLNETVYWEIIKKGADLLDPKDLPISRGPLDEFTMAEKVATERFMREAGYGLSLANQRQCRLFWRRLIQMRNAGADKILLYRTKEFDRFCKSYSSEAGADLIEMVRLWEENYGVHIRQLEERVAEESRGDMTGRLWLSQSFVAERLNDPAIEWNSAINRWSSTVEETVFQSSGSHEPSATPLGGFFDLQPQAATTRNKSIFVTIQPKDDNFLVVCPIIAVQEGDILGVYAGEIRYSADCHYAYGIPGPRENLWLDYSKVTGVLNFMKVSAPGGDSNVRLQWDLIDERKEVNAYLKWRVTAVALREIKPFEELVRVAPRKEQYLLHRSIGCAKRGYTKYQCS